MILDQEQINIINSNESYKLVEAGAGCSKTEVNVRHAIEQSKLGKKILMVSFTNSNVKDIKKRLGERCDDMDILNNITITTIDSMISGYVRQIYEVQDISQFILDYPQFNYDYSEISSEHNLKADILYFWIIKNELYKKFNVLQCDEFQDAKQYPYKLSILIYIARLFGNCLFVGDSKQSLYDNSNPLSKDEILNVFTYTLENFHEIKRFTLKTNRRCSDKILDFVNNLTNQTLISKPSAINEKPSAINEKPSAINGKSSAINGKSSAINGKSSAINEKPVIITHGSLSSESNPIIKKNSIKNSKELAKFLINKMIELKAKHGFNWDDFVFLQRKTALKNEFGSNYIFCELEELMKKKNIPIVWIQKEDKNKSYKLVPIQDKVVLCSINYFKGLERQFVGLINCTQNSIPKRGDSLLTGLSYFNVGITRAKSYLYITCHQKYPSEYLNNPFIGGSCEIRPLFPNGKHQIKHELDFRLVKNEEKKKSINNLNVTQLASELANIPGVSKGIKSSLVTQLPITSLKMNDISKYFQMNSLETIVGQMAELLVLRYLYILQDKDINLSDSIFNFCKYNLYCDNKTFENKYKKERNYIKQFVQAKIREKGSWLNRREFKEIFLFFTDGSIESWGSEETLDRICMMMEISNTDYFTPHTRYEMEKIENSIIKYLDKDFEKLKEIIYDIPMSFYVKKSRNGLLYDNPILDLDTLIDNCKSISNYIFSISKDVNIQVSLTGRIENDIGNYVQVVGTPDIFDKDNNIYELKCMQSGEPCIGYILQVVLYRMLIKEEGYNQIINIMDGSIWSIDIDRESITRIEGYINDLLGK